MKPCHQATGRPTRQAALRLTLRRSLTTVSDIIITSWYHSLSGLQNGVKAMIVMAFVVVAMVVVYAILYQVNSTSFFDVFSYIFRYTRKPVQNDMQNRWKVDIQEIIGTSNTSHAHCDIELWASCIYIFIHQYSYWQFGVIKQYLRSRLHFFQ